jgi:hypothetical protein
MTIARIFIILIKKTPFPRKVMTLETNVTVREILTVIQIRMVLMPHYSRMISEGVDLTILVNMVTHVRVTSIVMGIVMALMPHISKMTSAEVTSTTPALPVQQGIGVRMILYPAMKQTIVEKAIVVATHPHRS